MADYQLAVIGGGPAGLAAALSAWEHGLRRIVILERANDLGGILNQCIHNGFGLHHFKEELTGPEYAARFVEAVKDTDIEVLCNTMVLQVSENRAVSYVNEQGYHTVQADAVVLAMGCRERSRGAIATPGNRPAGVITAGAAQRYVNIEGYMPGQRVVILGSGDIGLIMARRMTLEGAEVVACIEVMPYSGGLIRNIVQCLDDFDIPLYLSHTITSIHGDKRVSGVTVAEVDEKRNPIPGTEFDISCDTVLLSVGLIPENELSKAANVSIDAKTNGPLVFENRETMVPGIFSCGNVLHVHDLVDYVTEEAELAGAAAAEFVNSGSESMPEQALRIVNGANIGYTIPQFIRLEKLGKFADIFFRVKKPIDNGRILVTCEGRVIAQYKRERMRPGEMERIHIPVSFLASAEKQLEICAEEGER